MKDTLDDFTVEELRAGNFPNWVRMGFNSKQECMDYIMDYMEKRRGLFERLGLTGPIIKKEKKKK